MMEENKNQKEDIEEIDILNIDSEDNKTKTTIEEISFDETEETERYPDVFRKYRPDAIAEYNVNKHIISFRCKNNITLKVYLLSEHIIRFRYAYRGVFDADFSYALDDQFVAAPPSFQIHDNEEDFQITTPNIHCHVNKQNLKVKICDSAGKIIVEDADGYEAKSTILKGTDKITITKKAKATEQYFGFGDKSCQLNLRGNKLENWCTDAFGYDEKMDPLYRSVPFYYGLHNGNAYGIFLDNSARSTFDFDSEENGEISYSINAGDINYYYIHGPQLIDVARRYTDITGRAELPPMWALGFHQCRWSYYPESRVRELANDFRAKKIPCDSIYLDIDYMDGWRCFTWNKEYFPDPKTMIKDLKDQGFHTVVMIDPGIKAEPGYFIYDDGIKNNAYCRRNEGELMIGPVWPSDCVFPDYTDPKVRAWWGPLYKELYNDQGVSGFWNDMNEPAVFKIDRKTFPDDVRHDFDGHHKGHKQAHNIYGMQMSRATKEGLLGLKPHKRPFILTRASFSGGQRYAAAWTGDNVASWKHLQLANTQSQRMSVSGFSFIGSDIGGFVDKPTGELLVRWLQLGAFHPLYRVHSMGNNVDGAAEVDESIKSAEELDRLDQEPWSFGDKYTDIAREAIELRYQLLPYLYSAFWQYTTEGTPVLKQLAFYDQADEKIFGREVEFIFGDHILVCPVVEEGSTSQNVYLPKGKWFNYWTEEELLGGQEIEVDAPLNQIPLFIKAGAVIPHYPVRQYTGEKVEKLTLHVYYKKSDYQSLFYEDAGEGYNYKNGDYSLKTYQTEGSKQSLKLTQQRAGNFRESYDSCTLVFHGIPFEVNKCQVGDDVVEINKENYQGNAVYKVTLSNNFSSIELSA